MKGSVLFPNLVNNNSKKSSDLSKLWDIMGTSSNLVYAQDQAHIQSWSRVGLGCLAALDSFEETDR